MGGLGQLHHVDIVAFAAEPFDVCSPTEFSEIDGCNEAVEIPLIIYFNMIETFGSGRYGLVVWLN